MCGDEAVAPHKGKRVGLLRQFIPRKPHSTGLKLYVLDDGSGPYVYHVYLYTGKRRPLHRARGVAARATADEMVKKWATLGPENCCLVVDSYFSSHAAADDLAARGTPLIMLPKRAAAGVGALSRGSTPHSMRSGVRKDTPYGIYTYNNTKEGQKAARVVAFFSNVSVSRGWHTHKRGYHLPPPVYMYRHMSPAVGTCNQLALQLREPNRVTRWTIAVRAILLRYAVRNAFAICKHSELVAPCETLRDVQWRSIKAIASHVPKLQRPGPVHCPVAGDGNSGYCIHCGGQRATWKCAACGHWLHLKCFAADHGL